MIWLLFILCNVVSAWNDYGCTDSSECHNGGNCQHGVCFCGEGNLVAASGWRGVDCTDFECDYNSQCHNGGHCVVDGWGGNCVCGPRYRTKLDCSVWDCPNDSHCLNGGTCEGNTCTCTANYKGVDCSVWKCLNNDNCLNDGTCYSDTCTCTANYEGADCSVWKCLNNDNCLNGGSCNSGTCTCVEGRTGRDCSEFDCSATAVCQNGGTCNSDNTCTCLSNYEGADCSVFKCNGGTCLNGGSCVNNECVCTPGHTGQDCSGFGYASGSCSIGFEGPDCNICTDCESCSGEYYEETAVRVFMKKDYIIKMEEKPVTRFGREYNEAPARAVMISNAKTVDQCYSVCMTGTSAAKKAVSEAYSRRRVTGDTWIDMRDLNSNGELGFTLPGDLFYFRSNAEVDIPSSFESVYYKGEYPWYRYDGVYTGRRQWKTTDGITYKHCDMDTFIKDTTDNVCFTGYNVPHYEYNVPHYEYTMGPEFWNTYSKNNITHFGLISGTKGSDSVGTCVCYTAKEGDIGKVETITYNPKTTWDTKAVCSDCGADGKITVTSEVKKHDGTSYFYEENKEVCIQCSDNEHVVSGDHCCPLGKYGDHCELSIPPPCASMPCPSDRLCLETSNQTEVSGPIGIGAHVCICEEGIAGDDCDKYCCIRDESVVGFDGAIVNGKCNYVNGGCDCDYGFMGSHCQCSDSMCGHGYCNPEIDDYTIGEKRWRCKSNSLKIYYELIRVVDEPTDHGDGTITYTTYDRAPTKQELFDAHHVMVDSSGCTETTTAYTYYSDAGGTYDIFECNDTPTFDISNVPSICQSGYERDDTNSYDSTPNMCKCHPGYELDDGVWGCEVNQVRIDRPAGFTLEEGHYWDDVYYWAYDGGQLTNYYALNDEFVMQKYFNSVGETYDTSYGCEFKRGPIQIGYSIFHSDNPDYVHQHTLVCNKVLTFVDKFRLCQDGTKQLVHPKCTKNIRECDVEDVDCGHGECVDLIDAYRCKCDIGYYGEHCDEETGWDLGNQTCPDDQYLVEGRCIDCPVGTYSNRGDDTRCRVILTDDNIKDAVRDAMCERGICDSRLATRAVNWCYTGEYEIYPDDHVYAGQTHHIYNSEEAQQENSYALGIDIGPVFITGEFARLAPYDGYEAVCIEACRTRLGSKLEAVVVEPASEGSNGCRCSTTNPYTPICRNNPGRDTYLDDGTYVFAYDYAGLYPIYAVNRPKVNLYGDIEDFDTSKVTNMDGLFINKAVPDISGWKLSSVTSMRNMFAGSTGTFDRSSWDLNGKDITNIYAGSELQTEFVERTSGSCLDNLKSQVRPVLSSNECLYAQYDAETEFSQTVSVTTLNATASRQGCRYAIAANSHEFDFRELNIEDLEDCSTDVPCLCAKIRPGEYVKETECSGVYEIIDTPWECTIAVRHLGEFYGVVSLTDGKCIHSGESVCKMREYPKCSDTVEPCMHNGLLCKSGVIIDDVCKVDNDALKDMVRLWDLYGDASKWLYGPLKDWDVHYVTNTTDLFTSGNPDITLWDMSNVVHADRMFQGSSFNYSLDNKDFSSLQTADGMFPTDYTHRACGKHFVRAGKTAGTTGFESHGECLTSWAVNNVSVIKQAVDDWFDGDRDAATAKYGEMTEWDVSEVTVMEGLFKGRQDIPSLAKWDVGQVTNMGSMFENSTFNEDIRHWDVRKVTNFHYMFKENTDFAQDLTFWELAASNHTGMFSGNVNYIGLDFQIPTFTALNDITFKEQLAEYFAGTLDVKTYGNISDWITFNVTKMDGAFRDKQFNGDISRWVVSSVTDMTSMFEGSTFNGDISGWQVTKVKNMSSMFKDSQFNQMIGRWNVSNVEDMSGMFQNARFSRPIDHWDLFATEPDEVQAANDDNDYCIEHRGEIVNLDSYNRASLAARRQCFDICTGEYPVSLPDPEGRNRYRGGGIVGDDYTAYTGGFGIVTNELKNHSCMCATETTKCVGEVSPFDYVYDFRDMDTTDMFKDNEYFMQPLCGLGWRYRDISSLNAVQRQVSTTCDICKPGQHMSECGICFGEFRFDHCMSSPIGFTLPELMEIDESLVIKDIGSLRNHEQLRVNPEACGCDYNWEPAPSSLWDSDAVWNSLVGCPIVNGRKITRMEEWFATGLINLKEDIRWYMDSIEYYCELSYLNDRAVAAAEGFNSVSCTEDTMLDRFECGLVGGNWDGECDKCLEPCLDAALGEKVVSKNRTCTYCPEGHTVFQNECVMCPDGKFTDENYAYCGKCPQGTYGEDGVCNTCDNGKASALEGAIRCDMCGIGRFSIGTECAECLEGTNSTQGSNTCEEARYCWHGNTSDGTELGNYCQGKCNDRFKLEGDTCISACEYGVFTVDASGDYHCICNKGKWGGLDCDECPDQYDFTYLSPEKCEERECSDTMVTNCWCKDRVVKKNENLFCYAGKSVPECGTTDSECMCDMGDEYDDMGGEYEWAPGGTKCFGNQIIKECDLFGDVGTGSNVPFEPCADAEYECKYGAKAAVCTDAFHCEPRHFEPGRDCCNAGYCSHVDCRGQVRKVGEYGVSETECCSQL